MNNINWKKNTALFVVSQQLSLFGSSIVGFAIVWYITLETSSGIMMTISTLCAFLPQIIVSIPAGIWADRFSRKKIIILADGMTALVTLILGILFIMGNESFVMLFVVSAIRSFFSGIQMPAVAAILPQIVPSEHLARVTGINSTLNSVLLLLSPAAGGALLGILGFGAALLSDVVTASLAIIVLLFIKVRTIERAEKQVGMPSRNEYLSDIKEGIKYIKEHSFLLKLLIFYGILFFLVTPAALMTPLMVERTFGPEVWRLTVNEMVWTVGSLLGGVFVAIKGKFERKFLTIGVATLGFGVSFILLGLMPTFTLYLVAMGFGGLFMPILSTAETVLIQEKVAEDMLGRVFSVVQIIVSLVMPLAMIIFGPLGDVIRIEILLIITGILMIILAPYVARIGKGEL